MITNFEEITKELTDVELEILPAVIRAFCNYSKDNPIKEPEIVKRFNANMSVKLSGARLRKLVNHIRSNGLLPLIATKNGYYVSYDKKEIEGQIKSLNQRAVSIKNCANGLSKFIS